MTNAKVITLKIKMNNKYSMNLVTTVDPAVTPEMVCRMYRLRGQVVSTITSEIMPLPFALYHSEKLKAKLGII